VSYKRIMANTPTLTVRLPNEVRRKLEVRARRERVTVGQYARRILWDHVDPEPTVSLSVSQGTTATDAGNPVCELAEADQ
jgi:plasmid stability protein